MNSIFSAFQYILVSFFTVLYQFTSFQVGDFSTTSMFQQLYTNFIHSSVAITLEIILTVVSLASMIGLIVLILKKGDLMTRLAAQREIIPREPQLEGQLGNRWQEVMRHIDSTVESEWKFAVIEADKIVDDILKERFPGETMGERLTNIDKTQLLTIDGLWEAHKIRNRLAHEVNYFLRHAEAVRALRLYEETLKEMGVLAPDQVEV